MPAGRNQEVDVAQLSDDLLETQIMLQITDPAAGDEFYLVGAARSAMDITHVATKTIGGEARLALSVQDAVPNVEMDPVSTNADVDTNGDMLTQEGDWLHYDVTGGDTAGLGSPEIDEGEQAKLTVTGITDDVTAGMTVLVDISVIRRRNV